MGANIKSGMIVRHGVKTIMLFFVIAFGLSHQLVQDIYLNAMKDGVENACWLELFDFMVVLILTILIANSIVKY